MSRIPARRVFPVLITAMLAAAVLVPARAEPVAARDGTTFVSLVNERRAAHSVAPVSLHAVVDQISVERADRMAAAGTLSHDLEYVKARLNQSGVCWTRLGEIIAYNSVSSVQDRIKRFVEQWYASTKGHKELMLNAEYTHAGGSWTTASNGRHYAAMVFITSCGGATLPAPSPTPAPTSSSGFTDIGASPFASEIGWLVQNKITAGCAADRYCPAQNVTREQMASFLRRATGIAATASGWFTDISSSNHRYDINGVAAAGIAAGCASSRYCPANAVTRAQMASFLARALKLPPPNRDWFNDDHGSIHEADINRLADAGITGGCSAGRFCPDAPVTREQMAAFVYRAFGR